MEGRKCGATTQAGKPCRALALSDGPFCIGHDPRPEKHAILVGGARRGGEVRQYIASLEVPEVGTPKQIRLLLSRVMREVAAGRMPTGVAFVMNSLSATALQAMRAERETAEPGKALEPVLLTWPWERTEPNA